MLIESVLLPIYAVGILLCLYMAWNLGANDAANPTECAVGAGVISMRRAVILFALFAALGGILLGPFVMKTIDRGIVLMGELPDRTVILGSFTSILAAGTFVALCTWKGMPTSTTHSIIGGVLGFGLIASPPLISWDKVSIIFASLAISPILSMFMASSLFKAFRRYFGRPRREGTHLAMNSFVIFVLCFATLLTICQKVLKLLLYEAIGVALTGAIIVALISVFWLQRYRKGMEGTIGNLLIVALAFSAFAFGGNDMANATGVFVTATGRIVGTPPLETMFILSALGAVFIAVGGFTWGYRVINTAAFKVTRIDPITGLAAEYSNALTIFAFTVIPKYLIGFGIPISTTHSSVGSIMGAGLARWGRAGLSKRVVGKILLTWSLTIPCTALLSMAFFGLSNLLIPA